MESKATNEEVELRVSVMVRLISEGYDQSDAVNWCVDNTTWGAAMTKRNLRNYYKRAQESLRNEALMIDRRQDFAAVRRGLWLVYNQALQANDWRAAIVALKEVRELMNLTQQDALALDWKDEMRQLENGADPQQVFEAMVQQASARLAANGGELPSGE